MELRTTAQLVFDYLQPFGLLDEENVQFCSNRPWSHVSDLMALVVTITNGEQGALYFRGDECIKLNVSV